MGVVMKTKPVFSPQFFRELAQDNPLGMTISPELAEAWWHWVAWPTYKSYRYRAHKRAVRQWWSAVTVLNLQRAQDAIDNQRAEQAARAQAEVIHPLPAVDYGQSELKRLEDKVMKSIVQMFGACP